jgi:hypothetical protein
MIQLLRDVLASYNDNPVDVDLYHDEYDEEFPTMAECCLKEFTDEGLKEFEKVLNAKVEKIRPEGKDWVSIFVTGIKHSEVERLSLSQAGYCSVEDYQKWFCNISC